MPQAPAPLPHADTRQPDPLQAPTQFTTPQASAKAASPALEMAKPEEKSRKPGLWSRLTGNDTAATPTRPVPAPVAEPRVIETRPVVHQDTPVAPAPAKPVEHVSPVPAPAQPPMSAAPAPQGQVPLGVGSVMAAGDGTPGSVRYIPVPIVTMPDVAHMPGAPGAPVPRPPQPVPQSAMGYPTAQPSRPFGPPPTTTDPGMVNAFTPMPSNEETARATNAFGQVEGTPMPPAMPGQQGPAAPAMFPQRGGMMVMPMPPAGAPIPAGYQGSMMPTPGMPTAAAGAKGSPLDPQVMQQLKVKTMVTLRDALYPSQRECAAETLAGMDWRSHPDVVLALVTAAREDPAATVRADCVRCLARMNVTTAPVITAIQGLRTDADPRVRQEADVALTVLSPGQSVASPGVLPASAVMPVK
jgi:hypothetical protein